MAANLITLLYLSVKYLNSSHQNHLLIILLVSFLSSITQVLFFNNTSWIFTEEICPHNFTLSFISRLRLVFNRQLHKKNIFYGVWNQTNVVLKEYPVCEDCLGLDDDEYRSNYFQNLIPSNELKSLVVCPTVDGFHYVKMYRNLSFESTTEPLILDMLSPNLGWPVPKSFGIWGNVLIQEYIGATLSSFAGVDWTTKAKIAVGLLAMARVFTFGHDRFSFYFTDISPDNIAIRDNLETVLVDLDHVIVVDRHAFSTQSQHVSETSNDGVFMFSTQDICKNSVSDLNYYSVCEHIFRHSEILSHNWLLTGLPEGYSELRGLIQECAAPVQSDRISAGKSLEKLLASILA